jgi:hypothetical protein
MYSFEVPKDRIEILEKWMDQHKCKCKGSATTIGGRFTYVFTPTSIGVFITVKCVCGKHISLDEQENL